MTRPKNITNKIYIVYKDTEGVYNFKVGNISYQSGVKNTLVADGRAYLTTSYPDLFKVIGYTYSDLYITKYFRFPLVRKLLKLPLSYSIPREDFNPIYFNVPDLRGQIL